MRKRVGPCRGSRGQWISTICFQAVCGQGFTIATLLAQPRTDFTTIAIRRRRSSGYYCSPLSLEGGISEGEEGRGVLQAS